jgi:hypothetical protein
MPRGHIHRPKSFLKERRMQNFMVISEGDFNEGAETL